MTASRVVNNRPGLEGPIGNVGKVRNPNLDSIFRHSIEVPQVRISRACCGHRRLLVRS